MNTDKAKALLEAAIQECPTSYFRCSCPIHQARETTERGGRKLLAWAIGAVEALEDKARCTCTFYDLGELEPPPSCARCKALAEWDKLWE